MKLAYRSIPVLALAAASVVLLSRGPAMSIAAEGATAAPMNHLIKMKDNVFDPVDTTIKVGDSVTFENVGANTHTATSDDLATGNPKDTFNTGRVKPTQKAVINCNTATTLKFRCEFHGTMKGTITVQP